MRTMTSAPDQSKVRKPVFTDMPSAMVVGATGILGRAIVNHLAKDPSKWNTVFALSHSQSVNFPDGVIGRQVDLIATSSEIAEQLKDVEAEYLFFNAYFQKSSAHEEYETNGSLLRKFLEALTITGAEKRLKRVLIPGGGKQYGLHLGPAKQPCEEEDKRIDGPDRPPNFYYLQQDILKEFSDGKSWDWVVTLPNNVVGFARGNYMNLATAIALYAVITRELGEDLYYPGSQDLYMGYDSFTSSDLYAKFNEWAALEPKASNQIFNVVNGDVQSWQSLWPKVAKRFGVRIPHDQFSRPAPLPSRLEIDQPTPLSEYAETSGLTGVIQNGFVEQRVDLVRWSNRPQVKKAWEALSEREGLEKDALVKASFMFAGMVLGRNYDIVMNMSKARKYGWTGYVDSWDAYAQTFDELEAEKIIPTLQI